ncbi:MAG: tetratricopeptide repeat protein [Planctomycetota bacterium]
MSPSCRPALCRFYQRFLRNRDSAQFAHEVLDSYSMATLERLAYQGEPEVRRAAVLALGHLGDFRCNHVIGRALRDSDRGVRLVAERYCREIWATGGLTQHRQALAVADRLETVGRFEEAFEIASQICMADPRYAEAWRHTGICLYGLNRNAKAIQHFRRALTLNPFQFEAAISLAQCFIDAQKPLLAYRWLRRASRIHPNLEQIRLEANRLLRATRGEP